MIIGLCSVAAAEQDTEKSQGLYTQKEKGELVNEESKIYTNYVIPTYTNTLQIQHFPLPSCKHLLLSVREMPEGPGVHGILGNTELFWLSSTRRIFIPNTIRQEKTCQI